jgi:hypothetical protein
VRWLTGIGMVVKRVSINYKLFSLASLSARRIRKHPTPNAYVKYMGSKRWNYVLGHVI